MSDSGLLLFVSLFPYPFHNPLPVPGVTSMLHEVREISKVTRKSERQDIYMSKNLCTLEMNVLIQVAMLMSWQAVLVDAVLLDSDVASLVN
jgi:hypothetical protein